MTSKLYSDMTPAEQAAIDQDEDRREARKAHFHDGLEGQRAKFRARRAEAVALGFKGDFLATCRSMAVTPPMTPPEWLLAADLVVLAYAPEDEDFEAEGPGITEPWEVAYGPSEG